MWQFECVSNYKILNNYLNKKMATLDRFHRFFSINTVPTFETHDKILSPWKGERENFNRPVEPRVVTLFVGRKRKNTLFMPFCLRGYGRQALASELLPFRVFPFPRRVLPSSLHAPFGRIRRRASRDPRCLIGEFYSFRSAGFLQVSRRPGIHPSDIVSRRHPCGNIG